MLSSVCPALTTSVCLRQGPVLHPSHVFRGHTDTVEAVAWHPTKSCGERAHYRSAEHLSPVPKFDWVDYYAVLTKLRCETQSAVRLAMIGGYCSGIADRKGVGRLCG
jgi:hypothetical protein